MSTSKSAAASEESYQNAKSSLVSSLVELSTAATQTATAALNFYKYAGTNGADAATASASLKTLSETVLAAANAASMTLANGSAPEPKRTIAKPQKKKDAAPAAAPASAPAPAPAPAPASVSAPSSASSDVTADTTMSDVLSTTDPALLKQGLEKPKKKRAEKDPNAPKKPVTSYLRFNLAERQRLKKERGESGQPTLQATELNQIIADRWATLDDVAKSELQRAYEADYEVYKKNVEDYKTKKLTELASAAQEAQGSPVLDAVSEPAAPKPAAPKPAAPKPAAPKPVAPKPAAQKPAAPKPAAQKPAPAQPAAVAPVPAADQASAPVPSSSTEKPKKKKKASKKNAEVSEADALALATETAKAAIAAEEAQVQPKPSKKRKDKDASEKSSKKKKSDPQA